MKLRTERAWLPGCFSFLRHRYAPAAEDISVLCETVHETDKGVMGKIQ